MYISEDVIMDIPQDFELEAKIIQCFKGKKDLLIFGVAEVTEEDIRYFNNLKQILGSSFSYDIQSMNEPWAFKNPIMTSYEMWCEWSNGRKVKKVNWYSADTEESLKKFLETEGVTYSCRIVENGNGPTNYKFKLKMDEHFLIIRDNEDEEHRSLLFEVRDPEAFTQEIQDKLNFIIDNESCDDNKQRCR